MELIFILSPSALFVSIRGFHDRHKSLLLTRVDRGGLLISLNLFFIFSLHWIEVTHVPNYVLEEYNSQLTDLMKIYLFHFSLRGSALDYLLQGIPKGFWFYKIC